MQNNYQQQALAGATGIELILALYDGAIRFLYRAIEAVDQNDVHERRIAVKRVTDILMYLQARLRPDVGGRPARTLSEFYAAMFTMTLEASSIASREGFQEVIWCIRNVREAWVEVAKDPEAQRMLPRELMTREERYKTPASQSAMPNMDDEPVATRWSA